jgi:hypothetical protein
VVDCYTVGNQTTSSDCTCTCSSLKIDWLIIDYLLFYVPLKNFSLRRHHCWWRDAKLRRMLGTQGNWAGRNLYRCTPAVTRVLNFSCIIWRTAPFSRLLRHTRECGRSSRVLIQSPLKTCKGMLRTYSYPDPHIFFPKTVGFLLKCTLFWNMRGWLAW